MLNNPTVAASMCYTNATVTDAAPDPREVRGIICRLGDTITTDHTTLSCDALPFCDAPISIRDTPISIRDDGSGRTITTVKPKTTETKKETEKPMPKANAAYSIPAVKHIVHNETKGTTTVYWGDDTKTTVRLMAGDTYDKYAAFCAACCKKLFGSSTMAKRIRDRHDIEYIKAVQAKERRTAEEAKLIRRNRYERRQARKIARQVQQDNRIADMVDEILASAKQ